MARYRKTKKPSGADIVPAVAILVIATALVKGGSFEAASDLLTAWFIAALVWGGAALTLIAASVWAYKRFQGVDKSDSLCWPAPGTNKPPSSHSQGVNTPGNKEPENGAIHKLATKRPTHWSASVINSLAWQHIEKLAFELLGAHYQAELTGRGADGGVDIRLYPKASEPQARPVGLVQVKAWRKQKAGVALIRELLGVMASEKVGKGFFVCTAGFTPDAQAFAQANGIDLIDAGKLLNMIELRRPEHQADLLVRFTKGDYQTPDCASCGVPMVKRASGKGVNKGKSFWGCRNFPMCRSVINS